MKMFYSRFTLLGALSIFFLPNASTFSCKVNGVSVDCPTISDDADKNWCCGDHCCTFEEYEAYDSWPPLGIIILFVAIIVSLLISICCRCIARRKAEERALLVLPTEQITAVPNANYPRQMYNSPLPSEPPPPYEMVPPYPAEQPPFNPNYGSVTGKTVPPSF